jgi:hypothetical protein
MSTLVITIDATPDIIMSASPSSPTDLGVTAYSEPVVLAATEYAPDSPYLHGSVALSWKYQQTLMNFTVCPFGAANEAEADTLVDALRDAVSRLGFNVTTTANGAAKVWLCDAGSVTPASARSRVNLDRPHLTEWNVTIPCYPVHD